MKISVLMSVYGRENPAYLSEALQSLAEQTRPAEEIVLVEDGPLTPELERTIESFRGRLNLVPVRLPENFGLAHALNEGLKHCRHELVARMDSDDICMPERFQVQADRFRADPALDVIGSAAIEIDQTGKHGALRIMPASHDSIVDNLWLCPFIHPSIMMRASRLRAVGGYRKEKLRRAEDYELWFRCCKQGFRFANIEEPLLLFRFTPATLRKLPPRLAWDQSMIGFRGARSIGMPLWKQAACFGPFFRSWLPVRANQAFYRWMQSVKARYFAR